MNKDLILNYWLLIFAWILFLNDFALVSMIVALISTVYFFYRCDRINYLRLVLITLLTYMGFLKLFYSYNITYFFPNLDNFMSIVCLNCAISNEYLKKCQGYIILPMLLITTIAFSITSLLIVIIPDSLYTIFTKKSLFYMDLFIFLPHLLMMAYNSFRNIYLKVNKKVTL